MIYLSGVLLSWTLPVIEQILGDIALVVCQKPRDAKAANHDLTASV